MKKERFLDENTMTISPPYRLIGHNGLKGCKKKFILSCEICSKDQELFPDGTFQITKGHFLSGNCPCNCYNRFVWKEWQQRIRVIRECTKRGYNFLGWSGEYKGSYTRLHLHNPATNNTWKTTSVAKFFMGRGDPEEGKVRSAKSRELPKETHLESVLEAFKDDPRDLKFHPLTSKKFKVVCNDCKDHVFSLEVSDVSTYFCEVSNLLKGQLCCACNPKYRMNKCETLLMCEITSQMCTTTFEDFSEEFKNCNNTSATFSCDKCNFIFKRFVGKWLRGNNSCPLCIQTCNRNGWYPEKKDDPDTLYVLKFTNGTCKIGRTFNINSRFSSFPEIENKTFYTGTHRDVYEVEQKILENLKIRGSRLDLGFTKEGFDTFEWDFVIGKIHDSGLLEKIL